MGVFNGPKPCNFIYIMKKRSRCEYHVYADACHQVTRYTKSSAEEFAENIRRFRGGKIVRGTLNERPD